MTGTRLDVGYGGNHRNLGESVDRMAKTWKTVKTGARRKNVTGTRLYVGYGGNHRNLGEIVDRIAKTAKTVKTGGSRENVTGTRLDVGYGGNHRNLGESVDRIAKTAKTVKNGWKSEKRDRDTARRRIRWESPKSGRNRRPNCQNGKTVKTGGSRENVTGTRLDVGYGGNHRNLGESVDRIAKTAKTVKNGWKSEKRDRDTARRRIRWESPKSGRKRRPNGQNVENGENGRKRVDVGKT